ncbi:MAG: hypothetical protein GC152_13610 [Alphaproteobacteria bacterium]|nr:hypothetical protein [Alphaproteobacteria bacterium]
MYVHLTVDTEFSAGGHWDNPALPPVTQRNVWCEVDGVSHGLGFILDAFACRGLKATYFVEAVHTAMLGVDDMRPAVEAICAAGQGLEIHAHPMWLAGMDGGRPAAAPNDECAACTGAELDRMLEISFAAFAAWGAPAPTAFRSGGLSAARNVYAALRRAGIGVASNVGLGVKPPADASLQRSTGRLLVDGVVEQPVTTYATIDPRPNVGQRIVTTTATGFREMTALMEQAEAAGLEDFVILTHPFEFVKADNAQMTGMKPNARIQKRLARLAEWLADRRDRFPTTTFAARADAWRQTPETPEIRLAAPPGAAIVRAVENAIDGRNGRTVIPPA